MKASETLFAVGVWATSVCGLIACVLGLAWGFSYHPLGAIAVLMATGPCLLIAGLICKRLSA